MWGSAVGRSLEDQHESMLLLAGARVCCQWLSQAYHYGNSIN